ncbi:unnamed protein product, partial [Mesorhabditis belari]|uniref:Uncharacterized protein n=1 Tax=Mesorhabditis belari TaxID=2138241 RepID=A0AAF3ELU1_9BILA
MTFGAKYYDLILVLLITLGLSSLLAVIQIFKLKSFTWPKTGFDISFKLSSQLTEIFDQNAEYAFFLGFPFAGLAAFYAATNNRLTIPVRLLSTAENANKFVQTLGYFPTFICELSLVFTCSKDLTYIFDRVSFYVDYYDLFSISQYCQLCISISQYWSISEIKPDIDPSISGQLTPIIERTEAVVLVLSVFISFFAIWNVLWNDRLTLPLRLLAANENVDKMIFAIIYTYYCVCKYLANDQCPQAVFDLITTINSYFDYHILNDIAQYNQLMISISRFLAVSFDGAYFPYTLRFPFIQPLLPYILRIGLSFLKNLFPFDFTYYYIFDLYILQFPYFFMCALDFVTNRKMKSLKKRGKTSRAERLLMIQMMANSFLTLINTLFMYSIMSIVNFFFDISLAFLVMRSLDFIRFFFFNFIMSLISVFCFRKPRDQKVQQRTNDGTAFTVSRRTTRNR